VILLLSVIVVTFWCLNGCGGDHSGESGYDVSPLLLPEALPKVHEILMRVWLEKVQLSH